MIYETKIMAPHGAYWNEKIDISEILGPDWQFNDYYFRIIGEVSVARTLENILRTSQNEELKMHLKKLYPEHII
jgi:hypothetical protein